MASKEEQDIMSANEIADELRKLIDSEKAENEPTSDADAALLEDALIKIEKFIVAENNEEENPETSTVAPQIPEGKPAVDTGLLNGPLSSLKSFLIRKSQDNIQK
jgi:hypothetical protein